MARRKVTDLNLKDDSQIWEAVTRRRKQEIERLDPKVAKAVLDSIPGQSKEDRQLPIPDRLELILRVNFKIASNVDLAIRKRRGAFRVLENLTSQLDKEIGNANTSTTATAVTTAVTTQPQSATANQTSRQLASATNASTSTSASTAASTNHSSDSRSKTNNNTHKSRSSITASLAAASAATVAEAASAGPNATPETNSTGSKKKTAARPATANAAPPPYQRTSTVVTARKANNASPSSPSHPRPSAPSMTETPTRPSTAGATATQKSSAAAPSSRGSQSKTNGAQQHTTPSDAASTNGKRKETTTTENGKNVLKNQNQNVMPTAKRSKTADAISSTDMLKTTSTAKKILSAIENSTKSLTPMVSAGKEVLYQDFAADGTPKSRSLYASAQKGREAVRVSYRPNWPNQDMCEVVGARLGIWEPYWHVEDSVVMGVTSPIESAHTYPQGKQLRDNRPLTLVAFTLAPLVDECFKKVNWGKSAMAKAAEGDCALVFQMLPIKRDPKKKRADCHLWPKGTFFSINGNPITLKQRTQANHDLKKWEYQSHPLDLSFHIKNPSVPNIITLCTYDKEPYAYSIAVCSYRPPTLLTRLLLEPGKLELYQMSMEEAKQKANNLISQQMVVLDDDDEDDNSNGDGGIGKFVFSLLDPVSMQVIQNPVRGRRCKHWQCFDLLKFMEVNAPVSGGRWRCPCCESFVSHLDLEVCAITKVALIKFANDISPTRARVEFHADGSYKLLPPQKLRYANRKRPESRSSNHPSVPTKRTPSEPIEIIDLD